MKLRARRLAIATLTWALATTSIPAASPAAVAAPRPSAAAVVLMDARTREVIYGQAEDVRRPIASTTKMLTAIVVIENTDLDGRIRVVPLAAKVGESSAELVAGERRTVRELLYALMLKSANDAASALALSVGKSFGGFTRMMNDKAAEIGATRSRFANAHGLTAPGHYSTARDLATIAAYGLNNPDFARIVKTRVARIPWPKHKYPRVFKNHNKLLWQYKGAIGVKTGFTDPAGHCLVGAARRGSTELVTVVLGAPTSIDALRITERLLSHGFAGYRTAQVITKDASYAQLPMLDAFGQKIGLVASRDVVVCAFEGDNGVSTECTVSPVTLPVLKGTVVGEVRAVRKGGVLGTAPLVAERDLDQPTLWDTLGAVWSGRLRDLSAAAEQGVVVH